jgi:hypothetical protein
MKICSRRSTAAPRGGVAGGRVEDGFTLCADRWRRVTAAMPRRSLRDPASAGPRNVLERSGEGRCVEAGSPSAIPIQSEPATR